MSNKTIEYEKLQALVDKIVNIISKFVAQVKEVFIKAWSSVKDILNKKISVRTKKYKKGKRYVHSYKKIKLFDCIRRYLV